MRWVVAGSLAMGARIAEEKLGIQAGQSAPAAGDVCFLARSTRPVRRRAGCPNIPPWLMRMMFWFGDAFILGPPHWPGLLLNLFGANLGLKIKRPAYLMEWNSQPAIGNRPLSEMVRLRADWPKQLRQTSFPLYDDSRRCAAARGRRLFSIA